MKVFFTSRFDRSLAKLVKGNEALATKVTWATNLLADNVRHPSLRRHKLENSGDWSISLDLSIRIIYKIAGDKIYLMDIGTHDDVY